MEKKKMEFQPVGKRTRLQRARREKEMREANKRARIEARSRYRKENVGCVKDNDDEEDDDDGDSDEEVKVVDSSVYWRRIYGLASKEVSKNVDVGVEEKGKPGWFNDDYHHMHDEKGKGVLYGGENGEDSDGSLEIVGERWNPLVVGEYDDDLDEDNEGGNKQSGCGGNGDVGQASAIQEGLVPLASQDAFDAAYLRMKKMRMVTREKIVVMVIAVELRHHKMKRMVIRKVVVVVMMMLMLVKLRLIQEGFVPVAFDNDKDEDGVKRGDGDSGGAPEIQEGFVPVALQNAKDAASIENDKDENGDKGGDCGDADVGRASAIQENFVPVAFQDAYDAPFFENDKDEGGDKGCDCGDGDSGRASEIQEDFVRVALQAPYDAASFDKDKDEDGVKGGNCGDGDSSGASATQEGSLSVEDASDSTSSEDDGGEISDEDYRVKEAEMCISSEESGSDGSKVDDESEEMSVAKIEEVIHVKLAAEGGKQSLNLPFASNSDGESTRIHRSDEDKAEICREKVSMGCQVSFHFELSSGGDEKKINDKDDFNNIGNGAEGVCGDCDANGLENINEPDGKDSERVSDVMSNRRIFEGLDLKVDTDSNAMVDDLVGKRTRSSYRLKYSWKNLSNSTLSHPVTIDVEDSSPFHDEDDYHGTPDEDPKPQDENDGKRKRVRSPKNSNVKIECELKSDCETGNVQTRKTDGENSTIVDMISMPQKKQRKRLKADEIENIFLNTILQHGNTGLRGLTSAVCEASISPKFDHVSQTSLPENSEEEEESERLFKQLDYALQVCDIGSTTCCLDDDDDVPPCDSAILQAKLCSEGKHYLIHDDEIGIRCKFCSFVKLEIRYVTPSFNKDPFGRTVKRTYDRLPYDEPIVSDGFQFPGLSYDPGAAHSDDSRGTVWDLILGTKRSLYPHQQEAFEFIWRNIGGAIKLDELVEPTKFGLGGCLICHAPSSRKTRLAITFLQSFIKHYPMSKPVIIVPSNMLLTWEQEFTRWNFDAPFLNMNKSELSGKEDLGVLKYARNMDLRTIRLAKLCSWAMGKGALGISYSLFAELAGERKGTDENIRQALLKQPGIVVLDEGHTARNDKSNILNVLYEVATKRRILLTETPFQNNFEELRNTLSLAREEFNNPLLLGDYVKLGKRRNSTEARGLMDCNVNNDRRMVELKKRMKPFVHVHKGEILRKALRGLFHSVLILKPSDLQRTCFPRLEGLNYGLELDHLVSIASVHPSLLYMCEQVPDFVDKVLLENHRADLNAGPKIKFLFELIKLTKGERILVFSQFLLPLTFIGDLLKSHFHWTDGKELLYMHGKQDMKQRQSFIKQFNDPTSDARVLLTKACCEGIHLVGASRVVLLDVVWNPSVERQAISRAYRLGQQKDVFVYHLITSGTQEEAKYYRKEEKDCYSEFIFSSSEGESGQNKSTRLRVLEDCALEEIMQHEKTKYMFKNIIYQRKADELIESFDPINL